LKIEFRQSFIRDLKRIKDDSLKKKIKATIEKIERADDLQDLLDIKKLHGKNNYYRMRIGDHRIGLIIDHDTVVFVRLLHRKEIYRYLK
jgi:mRNA interferase RelE/StbE